MSVYEDGIEYDLTVKLERKIMLLLNRNLHILPKNMKKDETIKNIKQQIKTLFEIEKKKNSTFGGEQ